MVRRKLSARYARSEDFDVAKDKRSDFRRLAENRTRHTLDMIRKLENLSNRGNYDYTDDEVQKIFGTLKSALEVAEGKFRRTSTRTPNFRL